MSLYRTGSLGAPGGAPVAPTPRPAAVRVPLPLYTPRWTYVIAVLNGLLWLAMTALGGSTNPRVLVAFGAKFVPAIMAGQYWRMLTAAFLHVGLPHLAFNTFALLSFGAEVERRYGPWRFLALYLVAGIAGNVLSYLGSIALSVGASGAIFGLLGAMLAYFGTYRQQFGAAGRRQLSSLAMVAALNLVWGFATPGIDNFAHLGGLVAGLVLGWAYCPRYEFNRTEWEGDDVIAVDRYSRGRALLVTAAVVVAMAILTEIGTRLYS